MKILLIPSWYYSNNTSAINGIFFKEFAEALAKAGHETAILYFEIESKIKKKNKGYNHCIVNNVQEFRYIQRNYTPKSSNGVELQKLLKTEYMSKMIELEFGKPDVIHLESSVMINITNKLKRKWNIPVIYTEHLSNLLSDNPGSFYKTRFEEATKTADVCVAISSVYEKKMKLYDYKHLVRIPNGLDSGMLKLSEEPMEFVVKAMGSLRKIKRYDSLIRAFAKFAENKEDVYLEIAGEGGERAALEKLIDSLNMRERVKLIGEVSRQNIPDFYNNTSVFVCSSLTETFSVVTAEALCSGIPVIATRCGGPEDMIDESNGILIDANDEYQLCFALDDMYNKKRMFNREIIHNNAIQKFDYMRVIAEYVKLYEGELRDV